MNLQIAIKDLCAYNFKANTCLLTSVRDRSSTDLLQQLHLNFEEINTGIQDVLSADGKSSQMGGQELDDLVSSSRALLGYVEVLSEEQLRDEVPYSLPSEGEVKMSRYDRIKQIIVYSTYRRGLVQLFF